MEKNRKTTYVFMAANNKKQFSFEFDAGAGDKILTRTGVVYDTTQAKFQEAINAENKTNIAAVTTTANSAKTTAESTQTRVTAAESKISALETKVTNLGSPAHFKGTIGNVKALYAIKGATNGDIYNVTAAIPATTYTNPNGTYTFGPYNAGTNFIWINSSASTGTEQDLSFWDDFGGKTITIDDASTTKKGVVKLDSTVAITGSAPSILTVGNTNTSEATAIKSFSLNFSYPLRVSDDTGGIVYLDYDDTKGLFVDDTSRKLEIKIATGLGFSNDGYLNVKLGSSLCLSTHTGNIEISTSNSIQKDDNGRPVVVAGTCLSDSITGVGLVYDPNTFIELSSGNSIYSQSTLGFNFACIEVGSNTNLIQKSLMPNNSGIAIDINTSQLANFVQTNSVLYCE